MAARPVLVVLVVCLSMVYAKQCKKLDNCRCEMDDGSGIIDLNDIDNKDGTPRFTGIKDTKVNNFTYSFNPCTPLKNQSNDCNDTNLCLKVRMDVSSDIVLYFPCGAAYPMFTVDNNSNVVLKYAENTHLHYTRSAEITLVCDSSNGQGTISPVSQYKPPYSKSPSSIYRAILRAKSACPSTSSSSGGLSIGSILLIIFFVLLLLYVVIGIIINVKVRNKQSLPEACPNYEFWAAFPSLVKDGCLFTVFTLKRCFMCAKRESYVEIANENRPLNQASII